MKQLSKPILLNMPAVMSNIYNTPGVSASKYRREPGLRVSHTVSLSRQRMRHAWPFLVLAIMMLSILCLILAVSISYDLFLFR